MAHTPTPSKAAVKGHPIHPMLIPFPIAFLVAALVTDVLFVVVDAPIWATVSAWLLGAGIATGLAAGIAGGVEFMGIDKVRRHATAMKHGIGNVVVIALALANLLIRLPDLTGAVQPWGLALSGITALGLVYTGWLGGQLSYKHMIGVNPSMDEASEPLIGSHTTRTGERRAA